MRAPATLLLLALAAGPLAAEEGLPDPLRGAGFEQQPGAMLPLDAVFTDHQGRQLALAELVGERPLVLVPAYYDCPMLCGMVFNALTQSLRTLAFDAGREFDVVAFSFDPLETPEQAAAARATAVERYGRGDGGWHFLTGDEAAIARLTEAIGFRYSAIEDSGEFAHAAGLVVVTPEGRVARYLFGVEFPPRDLRLGLVEAADERIGGLTEQVLLFCFRYDPTTGRYSAATLNLVRAGGILTVFALGIFMTVSLRRERRQRGARHP